MLHDEVLAKDSILNTPFSVWVDSSENIYIAERDSSRIKFIPRTKNRYFDKDMSANFIYTIALESLYLKCSFLLPRLLI